MGFFDHTDLSPAEKQALKKLETSLQTGSDEERAVLVNCNLERRVKDDIRLLFLKNVARHFTGYANALSAIDAGVPPLNDPIKPADLVLQGPKAATDNDRLWGQVKPYTWVRDFINRSSNETLDELPSESEIAAGDELPIEKLDVLSRPFANNRGFCWATYKSNLDLNPTTEELCCQLGLSYAPGTLLVKLIYRADAIIEGKCSIPTVVEARSYPAFQPADPGENIGRTRDLRDNSAKFEEWTHDPLIFGHLAEPIRRVTDDGGRVPASGLSNNYLRNKLA